LKKKGIAMTVKQHATMTSVKHVSQSRKAHEQLRALVADVPKMDWRPYRVPFTMRTQLARIAELKSYPSLLKS
jgi:hypothetical protein